MEFRSLLDAIKEKDDAKIAHWHDVVSNMMIKYLRTRYKATQQDAEDCTYESMLTIMEMIRDGEKMPGNPGGYLRMTIRNNYFKMKKKNDLKVGDEVLESESNGLDLENSFAKRELMDILNMCVDKLADVSRTFITFFLSRPGIRAEEVAARFDSTLSNVWVKKHRIQKELEECVRKSL